MYILYFYYTKIDKIYLSPVYRAKTGNAHLNIGEHFYLSIYCFRSFLFSTCSFFIACEI